VTSPSDGAVEFTKKESYILNTYHNWLNLRPEPIKPSKPSVEQFCSTCFVEFSHTYWFALEFLNRLFEEGGLP